MRCCVPNVTAGQFELPGQGARPLNYRDALVTYYRNGPLAGHVGKGRTHEILARDDWWPGMTEDVRKWCKRCVQCADERALPSVSAWTRTELYSRPIKVLQFDAITCRDRAQPGLAQYVLTCICCYSRWALFNPLERRDAYSMAEGLLFHVFLGVVMFPVVLRCDNANEFFGQVMQDLKSC